MQVRISERLFAHAVVARLMMFQSAPDDLVTQGVKTIVVQIMWRTEQRSCFSHQLAICGLICSCDGPASLACADHIDHMHGSLAALGALAFAAVGSGTERRIDQRSQRHGATRVSSA